MFDHESTADGDPLSARLGKVIELHVLGTAHF